MPSRPKLVIAQVVELNEPTVFHVTIAVYYVIASHTDIMEVKQPLICLPFPRVVITGFISSASLLYTRVILRVVGFLPSMPMLYTTRE